MAIAEGQRSKKYSDSVFQDKSKPQDIRNSNITAAKAVSDALRTSLGPKGMDKMIQAANGDVTITNDGATILKQMKVLHPAAKMLVELSKAQDVEAGDGTTTVVVIAGSLLGSAEGLMDKGIHPNVVSRGYQVAAEKAVEILNEMAVPLDLSDQKSLLKSATTALSSKVVSQYSDILAPIAVEAVNKVINPATDINVDLKDIKVVKKLGGTVEDTQLIEGILFNQRSAGTNAVTKIEKAKVALIQFCISPPKTDMEHQVIVSDYSHMDRILREERAYILNIVKEVKKAGCNVLLIQKSILRDAISDLALHYFSKMKIMVVRDIEREDIDFVCKSLNCKPIASLDHFVPEALGYANLVEEISEGGSKFVRVTGVANLGKTATIFLRGSNNLVLEEADRSLHDALCVIRCLVKKRALIPGGGAPEIELAMRLSEYSRTLSGTASYCVRAFAEALEVIPYTLAENAGLDAISTVTELRNRHAKGEKSTGINVRKGTVTNMFEENVIQPLLVSTSAVTLATETVRSILKIDDIVNTGS